MAKTADANHLPTKVKKSKRSFANYCLICFMISFSITCIVLAFYFHLRTKQGFFGSKSVPRIVIKRNHPTNSPLTAAVNSSSGSESQLNLTNTTNAISGQEKNSKVFFINQATTNSLNGTNVLNEEKVTRSIGRKLFPHENQVAPVLEVSKLSKNQSSNHEPLSSNL